MKTETTTMTATRALNELKLLNKRITKKIGNSCFITAKTGEVIQNTDCDATASLQSVHDLIARRENVKEALMLSNSATIVKIGKESMTVAAAIEKKSSIKYMEHLLGVLRDQRYVVKANVDRDNEASQERLDRLLESTFGKDLKARPSEITDISDTFWRTNKVELHDTIEIDRQIEDMDDYIDEFTSEVDLVLSESNAKTEITV